MKTDMRVYMAERRKRRRQDLIALKGGKCQVCGSDERLEFDHRDRTTKLFNLSGCYLDRAWDTILTELAKCDLLCFTCHRIKTVTYGETGGGLNKDLSPLTHGTMRMYDLGSCRCDPCRGAKRDYRHGKVSYSGH